MSKKTEDNLFDMVYMWGRVGLVTDSECNSYKSDMAKIKSQLLVKVINKLSFELGHPKDDLVYLIKEMIKKGEL